LRNAREYDSGMSTLLDVIDAANLLSISTRRVRAFVRSGTLPHVLLPNKEIRFIEADLKEWIESRKQYRQEAAQ
jgi:excisionase family DNA binding protein